MEIAPALGSRHNSASFVGTLDFASELRTAVLTGDEERIRLLLSALLRVKGPTNGQRFALQLHALQTLVAALRALAISDETTGLSNRRGFMQSATRLLDLAIRDRKTADLIYFEVSQPQCATDAPAPVTSEMRLRQVGNFMRDLFPSYGVYEVLGRLGAREFAALTLRKEYALRDSALRQSTGPRRRLELPGLQLNVGIVRFDPLRPVVIDELLQRAQQATHADARFARLASPGIRPPARTDALRSVSGRRNYGVARY